MIPALGYPESCGTSEALYVPPRSSLTRAASAASSSADPAQSRKTEHNTEVKYYPSDEPHGDIEKFAVVFRLH